MLEVPKGLIVWADDAEDSESEKLALRLGVPFIVEEEPPEAEWMLFFDEDGLFLNAGNFDGFHPFNVDYLSGEFLRRWKSATKNDLLVKAIGLKKGVRTVCDATCGLGYDAFFLSTFRDLDVLACERSPVAAELVLDALSRVKDTGRFEANPLFFHFGDSIEFLRSRPLGFDAVYLDPMYPREGQTAAPKKEMVVFSSLVGKDDDAEALFDAAWEACVKRVVVKRADDAPPITHKKAPDFSLSGKTVRFDIYLKA
jgi:16S rRNA (guanine1516-N2)-methyltransferase